MTKRKFGLSDHKYWINKGYKRKEEIYNWFREVCQANRLNSQLIEVQETLGKGETNKAYDKMKDLIWYITFNLKEFTGLSNVIAYNIDAFEERQVVIDLLSGLFKVDVTGIKIKKEIQDKEVTTKEMEELKEEIDDKPALIFGYNTKGEKEKAKLITRLIDGTPRYYLVGEKSKKCLKFSDEFKQFLKEQDDEQ